MCTGTASPSAVTPFAKAFAQMPVHLADEHHRPACGSDKLFHPVTFEPRDVTCRACQLELLPEVA